MGGGPPTPAADLYALGLIFYQMLAGQPAFRGDNASLVQRQLLEAPPPLERLNPSLPPTLVAIVNTATRKNPSDRYPGIAGFATAVREFFIPWYTEQLTRARTAPPQLAAVAARASRPMNNEQPAPPAPMITGKLEPPASHAVNTTGITRRLVPRSGKQAVIIPRPADHIKGPTLPTRMLGLGEIESRTARFWLVVAVVVLLLALLLWGIMSNFVHFA